MIVIEGPIEDVCVAADSYGNHEAPCVEGLLERIRELDEEHKKRNGWDATVRVRITIEVVK